MAEDISKLVEAIANTQDPAARHVLGQQLLRAVEDETAYYRDQNNIVVVDSTVIAAALITWVAVIVLVGFIIAYI